MSRLSGNKGIVILIILGVLGATALIFFYASQQDVELKITDDISGCDWLGSTDLFDSISIKEVLIGKDKENSRIFCYIPEQNNGKKIKLTFVSNSDRYKLNEAVEIVSDYDEICHIAVRCAGRKFCFDIVFTNLPITVIESNKNRSFIDDSKENETEARLRISEEGFVYGFYDIPSEIKLHGNTSLKFPKKAYKVSFSEKQIQSINGMHKVNSLILDAAYTDQSRIRNLLCSRIWTDISASSTFNLSLEGFFTEVFYNSEYLGIYICKTPVNRTGLGLEKSTSTSTPVVLKADSWINNMDSGTSYYGVSDENAYGFEIKYPNDKKLVSKAWFSILPELAEFYDSNAKKTYELTNSVFEIENYINVKLLNLLVCNTDNQLSKNNYFFKAALDSEDIYIIPWDMDLTLGLAWSNKEEDDEFDSALVPETAEVIQGFFLQPDSPEIEEAMKQRWVELRNSILTNDYFKTLIEEYSHTLSLGSAEREKEKWGYPEDVSLEIEYVERWLALRIATIDEFAESSK